MNIAELTQALYPFIQKAEKDLEEILKGPIKEYMTVAMANPNWLAAIMHTAGSEADEALRLARAAGEMDAEEIASEVTKRLATGVISTTLVPAVLPTSILTSTNQAIISCLREKAEDS